MEVVNLLRKAQLFHVTKQELGMLQELRNFSILQNMGGVWELSKSLMTDLENGILFPTEEALRKRQKVFGKNNFGLKNRLLGKFASILKMEYEVMRAGKKLLIQFKEIVVGDIVLLKTGTIIPCDGLLITKGNNTNSEIQVDEGVLVNMKGRGGEEQEDEEERKKKIHDFIKIKNFENPFLFSFTQNLAGKGKMLCTVVGVNSIYQREFFKTLQYYILDNKTKNINKIVQSVVGLKMDDNNNNGKNNKKKKKMNQSTKNISQENINNVSGTKLHVHSRFKDGLEMFNIPVGREGYYIVHWICRNGSVDLLKFLLKHFDLDLDIQTKKNKMTALSIATKYSQEVMQVLLDNGADPNIEDIFGRTSMFYAIRYGNIKYFRKIFDAKGRIDVKDKYKFNLLMFAVIYGSKLLKHLFRLTDVKKGNSSKRDIFKEIINDKDRDGNTAFFYACISAKSDEVLDLLVNKGCDVNCVNKMGRNVLHYLCMGDLYPFFFYYHKKRVLVFSCGEELKIPNVLINSKIAHKREQLSLNLNYRSLKRVFEKCVKEYNVDINKYDKAGLTPFHYLMLSSNLEQNRSLLSYVRKLLIIEDREEILRILEAFDDRDEINRKIYFKYAFTLLIYLQAVKKLGCEKTDDPLLVMKKEDSARNNIIQDVIGNEDVKKNV